MIIIPSGSRLPIAVFFSRNWVPYNPAGTPTIKIESQNQVTGAWTTPVDGLSVSKTATGLCYYEYNAPAGNYLHIVSITTTSTQVDQSTLVLEPILSGGWPDTLLGLAQQNFYIDTTVYDSDNNLTSARVRIYSDAASVGTDSNVLETFTLTAVFSDAGILTTYKMAKN